MEKARLTMTVPIYGLLEISRATWDHQMEKMEGSCGWPRRLKNAPKFRLERNMISDKTPILGQLS